MPLPKLDVLYEDNHLLVVIKPAGTLVQGDRTGDRSLLDIGKEWLVEKYQKSGNAFLGLVHRLDRPVAGVMVFAKSSKAAGRLSAQFRERSVQKSYLAVVQGKIDPPAGTLEHHIRRRDNNRRVHISRSPRSDASPASLDYAVLGTKAKKTLVQVAIHTGRHHQIRAQLAFIGHPIAGDLKYGSRVRLSDRKIALFAHEIGFSHPTLKHQMSFQADPPDEWPWSIFEPT